MTLLNNLLRNGNARADTIFLFSLTKGGVGDLMLRKVSQSEGERPQYLLSGTRLAILLSESGVDQSFFTLDSSGRYHHPKRAARLGTPRSLPVLNSSTHDIGFFTYTCFVVHLFLASLQIL